MTYRSSLKMVAIDQFLDELCPLNLIILRDFTVFRTSLCLQIFIWYLVHCFAISRYRSSWSFVSIHWFFSKFWPLDLERKKLWIWYQFSTLFFFSLLTDIHWYLVHCFAILSCRSSSSLVLIHLFFSKLWPMDLEKYYELSVICTFVDPPTCIAVSDSYKSKFSFVLLELFLIEYTTSRGLGIACNTFRMLIKCWLSRPYEILKIRSVWGWEGYYGLNNRKLN
jgi:hypothetical protein